MSQPSLQKSISRLRQAMKQDEQCIPAFIDQKKIHHRNIWIETQCIFGILSRLAQEKKLPDITISIILSQVKGHLGQIYQLTGEAEYTEMSVNYLISIRLEEYEQLACEEELYLVAANLQEFNKQYTQWHLEKE